MRQPFEEIASLDKLIHEPARLAILTALDACQSADFLFLERLTGLTKGNLSAHLAKLEAAGLVEIHKRFVGKLPNTSVQLTLKGHESIEEHWQRLNLLRQGAQVWQPHEDGEAAPL